MRSLVRALLTVFTLGTAWSLPALPAATAAPARAAQARKAVAKKPGKVRRTSARKSLARHRKGKRVAVERAVPWLKNGLPNVQAPGALVIDLETGKEVFSRRADEPRAIASISKLAAALVVVERGIELEGLTTVKRVDLDVARGGAQSRLLEGMTLSNRDLLHAALLGSDNRAVSAMGRAVGLGAAELAEAMTRKATALGLRRTRFREPTGLSPENVSTPRESILMLKAALAHPLLGPMLRRSEYDAHPVSRPSIRYVSTYRPADRSNTDLLGGKTGYNDVARYCLVVAAKVDGRSYGMAFLGAEGKMTRFGDVARVADWLVVHKPNREASTAVASTPAPSAVPQAEPAPPAPVTPPALHTAKAVAPAAAGVTKL